MNESPTRRLIDEVERMGYRVVPVEDYVSPALRRLGLFAAAWAGIAIGLIWR